MMNLKSYNDEKLKVKVRAELILDSNKEPVSSRRSSLKHYEIRLFLEGKNPNINQVVYKLDPSYYDPIRETSDEKNNFAIETTTYGDYYVTVDVQVGSEVVRQEILLSDLLKQSYTEKENAAIDQAIKDIEQN
jgi:transcription initiation factor IIF auxiliary subunit